jgi:uncharacterized protein YndB with AHSA1/START domain
MDQDLVFKALADPSRRKLLDVLFQEDGQTLSELQAHLPMTRFGAMKHLQILEAANLITTRKVGREKYHYLNPIPIQQAYDRWVSKYSQPFAQRMTDLKTLLEENDMSKSYTHVYEIMIRTTPEKLWQALTNGDITQQYYFGTRISNKLKAGKPYSYNYPDDVKAMGGDMSMPVVPGAAMIQGEVLTFDPPKKLVTTFRPLWAFPEGNAPLSTVAFEIEPLGPVCKLTLTHSDLDETSPLTQGIKSGWAQILSGLKTLLETGEPMTVA